MTEIGSKFYGKVTWFGRNDLALKAIVDSIPGTNLQLVSIGSGPIDWPIAAHPHVGEMLLVDSSHEVLKIVDRLKTDSWIPLSEIEGLCRNQPDYPNTDLSDRAHIEMGLARLTQAGLNSFMWSYETLQRPGLIMPAAVRPKIRTLELDACQLAPQFWKRKNLIHFGGVLHQMETNVDHPGCMDDFYQGLARNQKAVVHIHTPLTHLLRTEEEISKGWPHFLDQLENNGISPRFMTCVDAFISRGKFRANYSIVANRDFKPAISIDEWTHRFYKKWGVNVGLTTIHRDRSNYWERWQPREGKRFILAMHRLEPAIWREVSITWAALEEVLQKKNLLTFGRNIHDGLLFFHPEAII